MDDTVSTFTSSRHTSIDIYHLDQHNKYYRQTMYVYMDMNTCYYRVIKLARKIVHVVNAMIIFDFVMYYTNLLQTRGDPMLP